MTETEELYCIGCGALLQSTDREGLGFVPAASLQNREDHKELYCRRCFRLRHYNELATVSLTDDDFLRVLSKIGETDALVVNVVDIFDFSGSLIPGLQRFVGDNPILMVGNKEDLLPKSLKRSKLKDWMRQEANKVGLRPVAVSLVSAKKNHALADLMTTIEKYSKGRDVYVVGVTNVGKSTLINQIIKKQLGVAELITTSRFPGTTLDKIEIPLDDDHFMIDTPGIIHAQQMAHYLTGKDLALVAPQKEIKPKVYQLTGGQTLFLGALARFDYLTGGKSGVVVYTDNNLPLHRTKTENAVSFYERHAGELLQPPAKENLEQILPWERFEFKTEQKSDLVFAGLGWITVPADAVVAGWVPQGVGVTLRRTMI
ncbi:ribosome biogenesis GTPase YqeH [Liquorilactobacillus satsumensis]|uniref:ribosome biogenesis GTPase YqeH n=1 Tax=Liquorilactobacillus satsumensis TaxID=259059 RepID=UPI000704EF4D|nr:ribosome biogenesis GTPase YqeH [Liquorilactobacillus satsumensis]MCP9328320.1 ribosome biogenesis GTPase YqeH [Liquorilactobacillus satsumensis]